MNIATSIRNTVRGACLAAVCCGAALTAHADTEWIIMPKAAIGGLMQLHVNRDTFKGSKPVPNLIYDARKQYGGKYKFLRICNNRYCVAGINEKGLGVIFTGGDPTDDKNPPDSNLNFTPHNSTVIMLRRCATAEQAVKYMQSGFDKNLIVGSSIYLIADPYRAFVIECSPKHFASWELPHAFCVYTHCWKLPGMDDGSIGTADRAQWNYQREWATREFLRQAMEKNHKMIPLEDAMAVSRMTGPDTGKKTVLNGPSSKSTFAAFTLELDPEYPDYLSAVYVAFGPPRHTLYLPVPFIAADRLPEDVLNKQMFEAALERGKADGAVDPELVKMQKKIIDDFAKARRRARGMLRTDRGKDAENLLRETMNKQSAEIADFLKK